MGMTKKVIDKLPPIPSLPETSKVIERAGDEKVLKTAQVDIRSASIERQAIMKSVLESPMLAQRIIGLNQADTFKEFEALFHEAIKVFYNK